MIKQAPEIKLFCEFALVLELDFGSENKVQRKRNIFTLAPALVHVSLVKIMQALDFVLMSERASIVHPFSTNHEI